MNSMLKEIKISVMATLVLATFCLIYAGLVWAPAQLFWGAKANGSLVGDADAPLGSTLIGQGFSQPQYFHPRPSAAGNGYDGQNSGGTNLGPTSQKLMDSVKAAAAAYRKENGLAENAEIPGDAVTSSASGLDPHISPDNAALQAARVAKARKLGLEQLQVMIAKHTEGPDLGFIGDSRVNVLELNLDLDGKLK
jgi:K+-transporting ATPase ATPase C chain